MSESFDFIKSFDIEIYNNCIRLENAIYNRDYYQAVLIGRGISEDLTLKIANISYIMLKFAKNKQVIFATIYKKKQLQLKNNS